jgi:Spy/CpxP family protein refolding chaperone
MNMKKILTVAGAALLITALALPAFGRGPGWGGGWGDCPRGGARGGQGYDCPNYGPAAGTNLTDEQRNKLAELEKGFYDNTAQLRSQMINKRGELQVIMSTSNPDAEKARSLRKELSDLEGKLAQERLNLTLEERKINPDARLGGTYGRVLGRGMGRGPGMRDSRPMGGGYGPGGCCN